jgi:hypothetical protein
VISPEKTGVCVIFRVLIFSSQKVDLSLSAGKGAKVYHHSSLKNCVFWGRLLSSHLAFLLFACGSFEYKAEIYFGENGSIIYSKNL